MHVVVELDLDGALVIGKMMDPPPDGILTFFSWGQAGLRWEYSRGCLVTLRGCSWLPGEAVLSFCFPKLLCKTWIRLLWFVFRKVGGFSSRSGLATVGYLMEVADEPDEAIESPKWKM